MFQTGEALVTRPKERSVFVRPLTQKHLHMPLHVRPSCQLSHPTTYPGLSGPAEDPVAYPFTQECMHVVTQSSSSSVNTPKAPVEPPTTLNSQSKLQQDEQSWRPGGARTARCWIHSRIHVTRSALKIHSEILSQNSTNQ